MERTESFARLLYPGYRRTDPAGIDRRAAPTISDFECASSKNIFLRVLEGLARAK